jgi:hypothetical protein
MRKDDAVATLSEGGGGTVIEPLRCRGGELTAVSSAPSGGTNRRVLTALANGDSIEPGSPDAEAAHW